MRKDSVIFDIDGTISDDRHRQMYKPKRTDGCYDDYHDSLVDDTPMNENLIKQHTSRGRHIYFITTRPEKYRVETIDWLYEHLSLLPHAYTLLMRPKDNHESSPHAKRSMIRAEDIDLDDVALAYDDRPDVINMYRSMGLPTMRVNYGKEVCPQNIEVADILRDMADTFDERNDIYSNNYQCVAPVIKALFPEGMPPELVYSTHWHLFELIIVKLTRFANSNLTHKDSIHDTAVYAAMIESILRKGE